MFRLSIMCSSHKEVISANPQISYLKLLDIFELNLSQGIYTKNCHANWILVHVHSTLFTWSSNTTLWLFSLCKRILIEHQLLCNKYFLIWHIFNKEYRCFYLYILQGRIICCSIQCGVWSLVCFAVNVCRVCMWETYSELEYTFSFFIFYRQIHQIVETGVLCCDVV